MTHLGGYGIRRRFRRLSSDKDLTLSSRPSALRPKLRAAIDRANNFFERYVITRHGKSEAVLLAADDFEGLLETLDILSDQACVQRIADAQKELAEGGGRSLEAIRRELYLAIRELVYNELFEEPIGQLLLDSDMVRILVFSEETEEVLRWIP